MERPPMRPPRRRRIGECRARRACGIVAHLHFLPAAVSPRIFMARLPLEARMIRMSDVKRHPERLRHPADGGIELIADMPRILLAEPLDHTRAPADIGEIAKGRKLHPMVLPGSRGGELVGEEERDRVAGGLHWQAGRGGDSFRSPGTNDPLVRAAELYILVCIE